MPPHIMSLPKQPQIQNLQIILKSKYKSNRIFWVFPQLSSSIGWRVMVKKCWKILAPKFWHAQHLKGPICDVFSSTKPRIKLLVSKKQLHLFH